MKYSETLTEKRNAALAKADAVIAKAKDEARDLSTEEDADVSAVLDEVRALDEQISKHVELE